MLNLFQYLIPLFGFQWLRRFYACGVSRCAVSMATPFEWLAPFLASLFEWLRRLCGFAVSGFNFVEGFAVLCLRRFNGFAVSRCAVSSLTSLRASPFYGFARFSLRCLRILKKELKNKFSPFLIKDF